MRFGSRTMLVAAAAAALVVGWAGAAAADDVRTTSTDVSYDASTRTFTLHVGDTATAALSYYATATGKSGCDLTGRGSFVSLGSSSSEAGVVSNLTPEVTYTACGDVDDPAVQTVTFTAANPGTTTVTFAVDGFSSSSALVSAGTFDLTAATFTVVVLGNDGRDAPAIANDFLRDVADAETLAACQDVNGTNADKSDWHGQLITKIAQFFEGQSFTEDEEHIVVEKVLEYCGTT